ncbi:PREDICTED: E3 ubiquitin-protein ligase BRE1-like [Ipomoea nil]|uniref:E3 ubiquitin-protein ligase BRE1-like n=1 Tax=Ipomoea nil TaxID=35883 RepID=UPI000901F9EB|nr:PREDICTED: E3 ubiquitin-protein ligase BRE1-like [Ipomoea nil]XP_019174788.1 PREDICTED: E3 ubiquitin-protein ligase BRE1-like [Ipomoea nil]XP_019174789.1 PREDICTED: E3 ubiquitin-protein ligase BRE1-like [Ipomoea nil]XP_019174790.1 PREDICTED: E3 ubiquitin-protein ligase BRE1-like [Ipomoea nil]
MLSTKKMRSFSSSSSPPPGKKLPFLPSSCSTLLIKYKPNISVLSIAIAKSLCHSENPSNPVSKMVLDIDLNGPPRVDDLLVRDDAIGVNTHLELGLPQLQVTANSDSIDDEVVICSPRSFAEAREKSRRNHQVIEVLDDETEAQGGPPDGFIFCRRRKVSRRNGANVSCINLETPEKYKERKGDKPEPKPKPPTFSCPVCMGQFVEETSTKCGHIFCKKCISTAIASQGKCPTCRQILKGKDTFRVYLPILD